MKSILSAFRSLAKQEANQEVEQKSKPNNSSDIGDNNYVNTVVGSADLGVGGFTTLGLYDVQETAGTQQKQEKSEPASKEESICNAVFTSSEGLYNTFGFLGDSAPSKASGDAKKEPATEEELRKLSENTFNPFI